MLSPCTLLGVDLKGPDGGMIVNHFLFNLNMVKFKHI